MKRSLFITMACILAATVASVQMTTAYMTDRPPYTENLFTMGTVDIELKEENWNPEDADTIHPLQSVSKDPAVTNTGTHPAYVFLEVKVPVKTIRIIDVNGRKTESTPQELFSFQADSQHWMLIQTEDHTDCRSYVYGYREVLSPGEQTTPLFETVTSVNYLEGDLDPADIQTIDIQAGAVQSQLDTEHLSMEQIYALLSAE